ncbi:ATP-binding protein [Lentzea sp.]|uniref:ATP-binding protein n=1 Tax=Lentzea sp. TaxID=56099 RepID=UPI002ED64049
MHSVAPAPVVPRQLPAAPGTFAGRAVELAGLDRALTPATPGTTVLVSAIGGAGGIGKTWLALAWAHRHLDRFPDGQLFVDLHGFSPAQEPMASPVAVRGFLDALGVEPGRIPADLDAQAALFRSLVAGRRMLVVLDNASTADQVVPLLPGSPTCTVLVTSRHRLASLIDRHGARHLPVDVLTGDEAHALLSARLGADRVDAEPGAVAELVALCAGHPLALSITARAAATGSDRPLAEVAAELRELGLEMLDHDTDPAASLPAVLSWSVRLLTDRHRTVFALLGIAPGPDTTPAAVAALCGLTPAETRKALAALEEASLIERRPHGRYAMHDLVRAYATTTARDLPDDVREAALVRVMDFHVHTAHAADRLLNPHRELVRPRLTVNGVGPHPLADAAAAAAWFQAEHATLLATQRAASTLGGHAAVWHLAWALDTYHRRRGHRHDALTTWRLALAASTHLPAPAIRVRTHRNLGHAHALLGRHEEAIENLDRALELAGCHHDRTQQAYTNQALGVAWTAQGDHRRALDHARRALDLYRALGLGVLEADALSQVGWCSARLGDFGQARGHCQAALELFRLHDDPAGEAAVLDSLGLIAHRTGDHRQAVDHYRQALGLFRSLGHTYGIANVLDTVGHPHAALGQLDLARETWRKALELYREQGRDSDAERVRRQLDDLG